MAFSTTPTTAARGLPGGAVALLAAALAGCGGGGAAPDVGEEVRSSQARVTSPVVSGDDAAALAAGNSAFAFDLHRATRSASGNLVSAPISVSLAFAMLEGGARGTTADEIAAAFHFTLPPERLHPAFDALDLALRAPPADGGGGFRLSLANAVWGGKGDTFLPEYLDLLAVNYGAGMRLVDFAGDTEAARVSINAWVSQQTADKIPELLAPGTVDPLTVLVLTNAVYFHADWQTPFDQPNFDGPFHAPGGDVTATMMRSSHQFFSIWTGAGYQAAELPYVGGTASMLIVVPDAGTFDSFEAGLTADALDAILAARSSAMMGAVFLPRFAFAADLDLKAVLQTLGVTSAFGDVADLSGIDGAHDLFVNAASHKAIIAVDQKGTEAAAATGVVVNTRSAPLVSLAADRPFLFFIRHEPTGTILFQGRVLDPTK
jgi:serpin B